MDYEFVLIEHYPDGTTWKHFFRTLKEAQWAEEDLRAAHGGRKYFIAPIELAPK